MKNIYTFITLAIILTSCGSKEPLSPRFNHVFLVVSDMERSVEFYTKAFDLKVTNDKIKHLVLTYEDGTQKQVESNVVLLKFPGQDFVFELKEVEKMDTIENFNLFQHVGISVKDIDKALKKALNAGAEITSPIRLVQTHGLALKNVFLKGPDGEDIELDQIISGEF
jgi:catechol 2,3-dioxygenase-like lactoylglutathione lyase family enzyme